MQKELSVEDAEKVMDEAAEGLAYCDEIGSILSEQLSDYDNEQVLEDLARMEEVHCTAALWRTAIYKLLCGRNGGELPQRCQMHQSHNQICQMCQSRSQRCQMHQCRRRQQQQVHLHSHHCKIAFMILLLCAYDLFLLTLL